MAARSPSRAVEGDTVRLHLPADPAYGRVARIAASSLALRLGLPYPEIEDLRIAVDETIILLLHPALRTTGLALEFRVGAGTLEVVAEADGKIQPPGLTADALTRFHEIVDDTVDEATVDLAGPRVVLRTRF